MEDILMLLNAIYALFSFTHKQKSSLEKLYEQVIYLDTPVIY